MRRGAHTRLAEARCNEGSTCKSPNSAEEISTRPLVVCRALWGSRTSALLLSGGVMVFVDQTAEDLCTPDHASGVR